MIETQNLLGMVVGKRYTVTKQSKDGTFGIGNRIYIDSDGSIINIDARGWIEECFVSEAIKGMEILND